ncbi:Rho GTPase activation protein [Limtongia smithiae]|uniref:Rho GTPase activation protein n=1 Tax=Limtongia smithiae TaxID=1125753 RepID=UPI0034CDB338
MADISNIQDYPTAGSARQFSSSSHATAPLEDDDPAIWEILTSDIGVQILNDTLKSRLASGKELVNLLQKSASASSRYATTLKDLSASVKKATTQNDSFSQNLIRSVQVHERLADNNLDFSSSLQRLQTELADQCKEVEKARKHQKRAIQDAEKSVEEAESVAAKKSHKNASVCAEYDAVMNGSGSKRTFKSGNGSQNEQALAIKVRATDQEYKIAVENAEQQLKKLQTIIRPDIVKRLHATLLELESAIALVFQGYSTLCERLQLSNGLVICPMDLDGNAALANSLTGIARTVDYRSDFREQVLAVQPQAILRAPKVAYKTNAAISMTYNTAGDPGAVRSVNSEIVPAARSTYRALPPSVSSTRPLQEYNTSANSGAIARGTTDSFSSSSPRPQENSYRISTQSANDIPPPPPYGVQGPRAAVPAAIIPAVIPPFSVGPSPVFGVSLDVLIENERQMLNLAEMNAPFIVQECSKAIEKFGINMAYIYKQPGDVTAVNKIKDLFNTPDYMSAANFSHPPGFFNDIYAVADCLKSFFALLPEPLLTNAAHASFLQASMQQNEIDRRRAVHTQINELPDGSYVTLKFLMLHLHKVVEDPRNGMSLEEIADAWADILAGPRNSMNSSMSSSGNIDVLRTILTYCAEIFIN